MVGQEIPSSENFSIPVEFIKQGNEQSDIKWGTKNAVVQNSLLKECNPTFERFMKILTNQENLFLNSNDLPAYLSERKKNKTRILVTKEENPISGIIIYNDEELCSEPALTSDVGTRLKDMEPQLITTQRPVMKSWHKSAK